MASEIDICNLALANLGDPATVASLDPPEGSAQAEHCARFYPHARDTLLEMFPWSFATKRASLAQVAFDWPQWQYAYATPSDMLRAVSILSPDSTDDQTVVAAHSEIKTPQVFAIEAASDGSRIILTNQEDATLRYTARVTDTTRFTPIFTQALVHHLASMLAGPIMKGDVGAAEAKRQTQFMQAFLSQEMLIDANQRVDDTRYVAPWIAGR